MKKIFATFCLLAMTQGAFAYIRGGTTSDIDNLQGRGYSQATLKIIDAEKSRVQREGEGNGRYERYYETSYYNEPRDKKGRRMYWYNRLKVYVDPKQDDTLFGEREINFYNKFFQDQPVTTKYEDL